MEKKEITIEQLKNYLGTGLNVKHPFEKLLWRLDIGNSNDEISIKTTLWMPAKPILYRLSDLDKFIPELGFVPINELIKQDWSEVQIALLKMGAYTHTAFGLMEWIFKNHFWPFGDEYFEQGLIIDKLRTI